MVMWGGARAAQLVCVPFGCGAKQGTAEWGKNARSLTLKLSCDAISLLSVRSHRLLSCKLGAFAKLPRQTVGQLSGVQLRLHAAGGGR